MEGLPAATKLLREVEVGLRVSPRRSKSGAPVGYKASNLNHWGCLQCRNFTNNQFNPECTTCGGSKPPHRFAITVNGVAYLWYSLFHLFSTFLHARLIDICFTFPASSHAHDCHNPGPHPGLHGNFLSQQCSNE